MEKILMITSDLASFKQVGFVELLRISPSSRLSDYGVRLKIDGQENRLLILLLIVINWDDKEIKQGGK